MCRDHALVPSRLGDGRAPGLLEPAPIRGVGKGLVPPVIRIDQVAAGKTKEIQEALVDDLDSVPAQKGECHGGGLEEVTETPITLGRKGLRQALGLGLDATAQLDVPGGQTQYHQAQGY